MSRTGKKLITIPAGVEVTYEGRTINAKGPKGQASLEIHKAVTLKRDGDKLQISISDNSQSSRELWGLQRTLVDNLIQGVFQGFKKALEVTGVGYRASVQGKEVILALGFSHEVRYRVPDNVTVTSSRPGEIIVSGIDKRCVGDVASALRGFRPPEPYKGKGVRYVEEYIVRKEGKKK